MMNNKMILLTCCAITILTGCQEERKNPLLSRPTMEILSWISMNKTQEIVACSKHWSTPEEALPSELKNCDSVAQNLAETMNNQKFAEDVRGKDIHLPYLWKEFYRHTQASKYDREKSAQSFSSDQKDSGEKKKYLVPPNLFNQSAQ